MTYVHIEESSDSGGIAQLIVETFAQQCYLSIHSHGSVKYNAEIAYTHRGMDNLITNAKSHMRQEVLKVIRDGNKELDLLLIELKPVNSHLKLDLINAC